MARIRTVKPDLFRHEALFEAEQESGLPLRLAFIGLFTACDREGRFEWRPRALKLDVLPYDNADFSKVLDALAKHGFIEKYSVNGSDYGRIPSWNNHQLINMREAKSKIPEPVNYSETHGNARALQCDVDEPTSIDPVINHEHLVSGFGYSFENKGENCSAQELTVNAREMHGNARALIENARGEVEGEGEGERKGNTAAQIAKNAIGLPLLGGGFITIKPEQIERFKVLYPNLDNEQELRNMIGFFDARPDELRPRTKIMQFVNSWLANRQTDYHNSNRADDLDLDDTSWAEGLALYQSEQAQ